ncbi:hypothetical protein LIER_21017 [Lithospermum erythrorhizon]|uniref:Uncharacterized protein n=1 Tax=Lithospermum erythrorhizon TaxID=34254 RepID=A0AAV3QNR2_LITER
MESVRDSYNSSISQFPESSRPIGIDNSNMYEQSYPYQFYGGYHEIENQGSGGEYMELAQHPFSCAMPQYPQPLRPIDIDYTNMFEETYPYQIYGDYHEYCHQELIEKYVSDDDLFHILGEIAQENDGSNDHEIFRKFFSKVKKEVHQENDLNPLRYQGRGINIEASSTNGHIKHKLERFKIKTLNLGGVVKEEKQS